jgi:uncharacterized membrane protein YfcA
VRSWNKQETAHLLELIGEGKTVLDAMAELGRSKPSIEAKLRNIATTAMFEGRTAEEIKKNSIGLSIFIGSVIGLLSGLIGIGGGIILSPVLLLLKWTDQKQTAAISALFIFVNSLSGLSGLLTKGINFSPDMFGYVAIAFAGGLFGSYFGSLKFNQNILKNTLAIVLLVAGIKLIFT